MITSNVWSRGNKIDKLMRNRDIGYKSYLFNILSHCEIIKIWPLNSIRPLVIKYVFICELCKVVITCAVDIKTLLCFILR